MQMKLKKRVEKRHGRPRRRRVTLIRKDRYAVIYTVDCTEDEDE